MANLGSLKVFLTADTNKFDKGLSKAQIRARSFAKSMRKTGLIVGSFAAAVGAGVAALNRLATIGDDIGKGAKKIGVTAEEFQKLGFAARRSGADVGNIATAFKRMASTIFDADNGLKESQRALEALGLTVDMVKGKKPEEQFRIIAERLNDVSDASTKAALAQDFFGRSGAELIPMIANYKELADEAQRLGLISDRSVKSAEEWKDQMENLKTSMTAVVMNTGLLEYMNEVLKVMMRINDLNPIKHRTALGTRGMEAGGLSAAIIKSTEARAERQRLEDERKRAPELAAEKKRQEIIAQEMKFRGDINKIVSRGADDFNKVLATMTGNFKLIGDSPFFDPDMWDDALNTIKEESTPLEDEAATTKRLASALQAGSAEAFRLRVGGRESKMVQKNLKANEQAARDLAIMVNSGISINNVGTVERI